MGVALLPMQVGAGFSLALTDWKQCRSGVMVRCTQPSRVEQRDRLLHTPPRLRVPVQAAGSLRSVHLQSSTCL